MQFFRKTAIPSGTAIGSPPFDLAKTACFSISSDAEVHEKTTIVRKNMLVSLIIMSGLYKLFTQKPTFAFESRLTTFFSNVCS
jgi:hypothetical protein